ncbi:CsbD family protein [Nocardia sp. NPDC088792]|uniref:CsbD family protein n=1 Tax=Nocardia sp. NPDC088792 TaxID=3364332 RepID=UPI00380B4FA3
MKSGKIRNRIDKFGGQVREATGQVLGDQRMIDRGRRTQLKADLKNVGERVKDAVRSGRTRRVRGPRTLR